MSGENDTMPIKGPNQQIVATDEIYGSDGNPDVHYMVCVLRPDQIELIVEAVVQRLRQDAGQGMQVRGDYKP